MTFLMKICINDVVVLADDVVAITASADKDVDLRQLPSSPKKRSSVDRSEPPPSKKSKAEVFDE